jgi:hypothetical protein
MRTLAKTKLALLSIALAATAAEKGFQVGAVTDYPHQESDHVIVGAKPFDSETETKAVFGKKTNLNQYGVLPVLLVIRNNRAQALDLNGLQVKLAATGVSSVNPIEPQDVASVAAPTERPTTSRNPLPHRVKKNPLDLLSIISKAFAARMLPAGEQASGFFYFRGHPEPGLRLLVSGIFERPSGKEIVYFEVPM